MSLLDQFDGLRADKIRQTAFLQRCLEHDNLEFFNELRERQRILSFWSHYRGNPDLSDVTESLPGEVLLLSRWQEVEPALKEMSMHQYARAPIRSGCEFVLSIDEPSSHHPKRSALIRTLTDPLLDERIHQSVHEAWITFAGYSHPYKRADVDIHQLARNIALRFTGKFFGIPEEKIFHGQENLEKWSLQAYENFIWKLHGRHFGEPEPEMDGALYKISSLVRSVAYHIAKMAHDGKLSNEPSTVISRIISERAAFPDELDVIHNIVGSIQGLIDNVALSISNAFEYIINKRLEEAKAAQFDHDKLLKLIHEAHRHYPPSPYLPRYGKLKQLGIDASKHGFDDDKAYPICCAIGSAIADQPASVREGDRWDIRMGTGMHQCVGKYIGDKIAVAAISQLLSLDNINVDYPVFRRWGWLVESFRIKSHRKRSFAAISYYTSKTKHRPYPISTWSEKPPSSKLEQANYVSWTSLTDRSFFSRHLDCSYPKTMDQEKEAAIEKLFERSIYIESKNTSALFPFFAQWLTDSFLRTDPGDLRKNRSNHHIDMCQIYGLNDETTSRLRSDKDGKLISDFIEDKNGDRHEVLPLLFENFIDSPKIKSHFADIPYVKEGKHETFIDRAGHPERSREYYFASGLERGNSHVGYSALSCLFLREHNRICDELIENEPQLGNCNERLFQTARLIVIALELKIVIEEYINHIASASSGEKPFVFDACFAEYQNWYRPNWISLEFDLLYRWHSMMPETLNIAGTTYKYNEDVTKNKLVVDNQLLITHGIEAVLGGASTQAAGQVGLFNTPAFLLPADKNSLELARKLRVKPYNEYRENFGLPRLQSMFELTKNQTTLDKLAFIYGEDINNVDFLVGIYAEDKEPGKMFGSLMTHMVAYDAFTHALTNPLLSKNVWSHKTFTKTGIKIIDNTHSLNDLMIRNTKISQNEFPSLTFKM